MQPDYIPVYSVSLRLRVVFYSTTLFQHLDILYSTYINVDAGHIIVPTHFLSTSKFHYWSHHLFNIVPKLKSIKPYSSLALQYPKRS